MRVAGLAPQVADGLVEAVGQHGQLAAVTQGAGGAARAAAAPARPGLLKTEERRDRGWGGGGGGLSVSEPLEVKLLQQVDVPAALSWLMYSNEPSDASVNPLKNAFSAGVVSQPGKMRP